MEKHKRDINMICILFLQLLFVASIDCHLYLRISASVLRLTFKHEINTEARSYTLHDRIYQHVSCKTLQCTQPRTIPLATPRSLFVEYTVILCAFSKHFCGLSE